ncbi:GNAT family N-acetyltransferase [Streptacidiphilus jiangxiensis]|uniref:Acetyltransferase (GNAT) family protein n=1 Tax=Streptacidiphilus jiangxiensis TaxID=235985 RepID=A0A1H7QS60_STRJI|nr:GNAT family N-acetyltransferase [Streptacidiphilus jiangxiensis]SEL50558.1 Acetyltransferase (GNAT) family protein [Streptacidiphilus jiangxiensis]
MTTYTLRTYTADDENSWLRCRVLSFLSTPYFDAVERTKPAIAAPGPELVVVDGDDHVVGIMDTGIEGGLATIDTVAIHPDHQRRGLGTRLLQETRARVRAAGADVLDAWTRDHEPTLAWYRSVGFAESDHYLHVYADLYTDPAEPQRAVVTAGADLRPVRAFLHAPLAQEERLRGEFARVHVCRRFSMTA